MDETKRKELDNAYRKEKDHRVVTRMLAVHMVCVRKKSIDETAIDLMRSPRWVRKWVDRFDAGGLDGLRDLPRSGRPTKIPRDIMDRLVAETVRSGCTPKDLQRRIREETGMRLYITNVRKILHRYGLSPKKPQRVHIRRAGKKTVRNWQYRLRRQIPCLEGAGFAVVMEDEAFFIHDVISGRKYWSPTGEPIILPYTGSHRRIAVYGSISKDGRQLFRTYEQFNASTFIEYLKELQRHFGRVAVITDRASPHRAKRVRKLLRANRNIKIIYLPRGSPYLNAMEECWHQGKRTLLVSEYYKTFSDMCRAVSMYYRTARFKLELLKFANRKAVSFHTNL